MKGLQFYTRGWRESFARFLATVKKELIIVAPYMRRQEAEFTAACLQDNIHVRVLTDINDAALASGALEAEAVLRFADSSRQNSVFNLPRLHAKIYVADARRAILSSANLTAGGLDHNFEYGVEISGGAVGRIRQDIADYQKIGTPLSAGQLQTIAALARAARAAGKRDKPAKMRAQEKALLLECLRLRAGERQPVTIFKQALQHVLAQSKEKEMTQANIQSAIQGIYPDLCAAQPHIAVGGVNYGQKWKHYLRNAQQVLKKQGLLEYLPLRKMWRLR